MRTDRALAVAGALAITVASAPAWGYRFSDEVEVFGYAQLWVTAYEQMQDAEGLYQRPSGDPAAASTTGFSLSRARIGVQLTAPRHPLQLYAQVKLERDLALLDLLVRWSPAEAFNLQFGQFKVPGTFEALTDDRELDFILRSNITNAIGDYALSRSAHPASLFYGVTSNFRDLGVAARGEVDARVGALRYLVMVGNGLGANLYIGGATRREFIVTNRPQLYLGARVELADVLDVLTLGAHGSRNRHDDMVFNSGRVVYDLDRTSASADLRVRVPGTGVRLTALLGRGALDDDFNGDARTDFDYSGWATAALWTVGPALEALGTQLPDGIDLELGVRFDRLDTELDRSGAPVRQDNLAVGANARFGENVRAAINYIARQTLDPSRPDLADDILFASVQASF